jgi:hypothetical protein
MPKTCGGEVVPRRSGRWIRHASQGSRVLQDPIEVVGHRQTREGGHVFWLYQFGHPLISFPLRQGSA